MRFPLLIFIIVPFAEIMLLLKVSQYIGAMTTVGLVLLTAFLGVNLLKRQGLSTLSKFQQRLQSGQIPAQEMVEGMLIAFSGALLLTPGFITDTIGLAGLLPPVRALIAKRILKSGKGFIGMSTFSAQTGFRQPGSPFESGNTVDGEIIDGEYRNESKPNPELGEDKND